MHLTTPLTSMEEGHRRDARTYSRSMMLAGAPRSPEALALVHLIVEEVVSPFKLAQGQLRPSSILKYRAIVGAFLADLFAAASADVWCKLATNTNAQSGRPGGPQAFKTMRSALGAAGLIEELPGYIRTYSLFGGEHSKAARTSFRPTPRLLELAASQGIGLADWHVHFDLGRSAAPEASLLLEMRAEKQSKGAEPKRLAVDLADPRAARLVADLQRLNEHLRAPGRIEGIAFSGLRRVFNNGDRPEFDWQWHGRYYSMPDADPYERMEGSTQTRKRVVRIDGEEVEEVDINASHLTILHGLLGVPFDNTCDPYECYDFGPNVDPLDRAKALKGPPRNRVDREKVKAWLLLALGSSNAAAGGSRHNQARRAGLARYPFLADLHSLGIGPLDLQYHEAEILRLAMEQLMVEHEIGFLPVHDALMVAKANVGLAERALRRAFGHYFLEILGMSTAPVPRLN